MSAIVGDVMHLHQALKQPDKEEFLKAMVQEISMHQKRKHWKVVPIEEVPENIKILDSIWDMRRKRKIGTGEISKKKARFSAHGGSTRIWDQLLGNLRSHCHVDNHQAYHYTSQC